MPNSRYVSLLQNGQSQVLTIPYEFTLPGTEVLLRKEGDRLIVEPIRRLPLLSLLATLETIAENFPDIDERLLPLDGVTL
ncbi:MAG TPA: AbrB/MazE/SpoVT family DNA-binding domain-containing protein [Kamptonema sp.]|nr:AbrB/MazE/SpoVT family DNA-binding domain-containing protein [Kamptonema sp.]